MRRSIWMLALCVAIAGCGKAMNSRGPAAAKSAQTAGDGAVAESEANYAVVGNPEGAKLAESKADEDSLLSKGREGKKNSGSKKVKTWKRAQIVPNTSRLKVGDKDELPLKGMQVNVQIDGFRARVTLDCFFQNNRARQLEGTFQIRLPAGASLDFFGFGETKYQAKQPKLAEGAFFGADDARKGSVTPKQILELRQHSWNDPKIARVVPREKASFAYRQTVRRRVDPALVEWAGAGVFNARVFPLAPNKLHRIVVGYDVNLTRAGDDLEFRLDLPGKVPEQVVDLMISDLPNSVTKLTPAPKKPFIGKGYKHYRYTQPDERTIIVRLPNAGTTLLTGNDTETGPYFATRFRPDLPKEAVAGSPRAVFLVDVSLSSNPVRFNIYLKLLKAILDNNRDSLKEFAVLYFNIEDFWWRESFTPNTPENVAALMKQAGTLSLEGATNLDRALKSASHPSWEKIKRLPARRDFFLLSDAALTWGESDLYSLTRPWRGGKAGAIFTYTTGMTGTDLRVMSHLARETGGAVFSVVGEAQVARASKAHRSRPWNIIDAEVTGGSDLLFAGRPKSIYPGQRLWLAGRGKPGNAEIVLTVERGNTKKTIRTKFTHTLASTLTPRVYGQLAVGQLEEFLDQTEDVAAAYARNFRVAGKTCSLLMLETEADYKRFNINPQQDEYVVKHKPAAKAVADAVKELGDLVGDPKKALQAWLKKLESAPGVEFKLPAALKLAIDKMPAASFVVPASPLEVQLRTWQGVPGDVQEQLASRKLEYDTIAAEAKRREDKHGLADALRALSSLVENNPGDTVLARDVAFSAMQWGLGGEAYHLFRRVAKLRPYEPQTYFAMARCLRDLKATDAAMTWYEVALAGRWNARFGAVRQIVGVDYLRFLRKIEAGELQSSVPDFAAARLRTLSGEFGSAKTDLMIVIGWNTDGTDVDLHIEEPGGEVCYYQHTQTKSGGRITQDVTQGYGPEMYTLRNSPSGEYRIRVKYFASDANRTATRTKVYATIYEDLGTPRERVFRRVVTLHGNKEMHDIATVKR